MKWEFRIFLSEEDGSRIFGKGPMNLLKKIRETGSLHQAAKELDMAYSKALKIIKNAEVHLGKPLIIRTTGGKAGGGSVLTQEAMELIENFENLESTIQEIIDKEPRMLM
jgi:molybdate transport repressor ModE-like protein